MKAKKTLTAKEAGEILQLSPGYIINRLVANGILPAVKDPQRRCWLIDAEAVANYRPKVVDKRPHINGNFTTNGSVPAAELRENRARLAERIAGLNPKRAAYCLSSGEEVSYIQWLVRGDGAK